MPRRFDFVSPGVQLTEVDQSRLETESTDDGALIIGTARSGPGMRPVRLKNKAHLFDVFGDPSAGVAGGDSDVWRDGNDVAPTYGLYAAQAWLASETSPVTFVRLLGNDSNNKGGTYTYAGWNLGSTTANAGTTAADTSVAAYGLFIIPSSSTYANYADSSIDIRYTGSLAAIIYASGSGLALSGAYGSVGKATSSAGALVQSVAANGGFRVEVWDSDSTFPNQGGTDVGVPAESFVVDFDQDSPNYIRNVMCTNPQKLDADNFGSSSTKKYWVGQTFERSVINMLTTAGSSSSGTQKGVLLPLLSGSALGYHENQREAQPAKTGWFVNRTTLTGSGNIADYNASRQDKLFRLVSLSEGEFFQNKYHVAIEDLKLGNSVNKNSSFSLVIKEYNGQEVEKYTNLNLDPNSPDYISARIGDQDQTWDSSAHKFTVTGENPNISDYVRVEVASGIENGSISDANKLPMGFLGPVKPRGFAVQSNNLGGNNKLVKPSEAHVATGVDEVATALNLYVTGGVSTEAPAWPVHNLSGKKFMLIDTAYLTASFKWPTIELTETGTNANSTNYLYSDHFGINIQKATLGGGHKDFLRELPSDSAAGNTATVHLGEAEYTPAPALELSFAFSLDDVVQSSGKYYWQSGSFEAGTSYSAINGGSALLDLNVKQFVAPFMGGTDGVDVTKTQPFSNAILSGQDETKTYSYYSVDKVLDIAREPELVAYDVLSMPGLTNITLTDKMISACEDRGDALAVIDVAGIYKPKYENAGTVSNGSVTSVISTVKARQTASTAYNSSYGATYYPSLRLTGDDGLSVTVPPSVGAIGALAKTDAVKAPWFAPAGFNQGGLSELGGRTGPKVTGVNDVLKKDERDQLYQLNVNPIARLSNQIVIFGQKTLQQTPSALDRVNVRRLMIYIKKRIGDIADTILFDQNLQATWNRFNAKADKVLAAIQAEFGLEEYKIVLDSSTTTPDLVDRNILYAKIFIKPARSIEFIAVDFVITRSGVEL